MYLTAKLFKMLPDNYRLVLRLHLYMLKAGITVSNQYHFSLLSWRRRKLFSVENTFYSKNVKRETFKVIDIGLGKVIALGQRLLNFRNEFK